MDLLSMRIMEFQENGGVVVTNLHRPCCPESLGRPYPFEFEMETGFG